MLTWCTWTILMKFTVFTSPLWTTPANICRLSIYTLCVVFAWMAEAIIVFRAVISYPFWITCTTSIIITWPMMTTIIKTGFDTCRCCWCCFLVCSCFTFLSCESMLTFTSDGFILTLTSTSILTGVWITCFQYITLFSISSQWTTTVVTPRCICTCSCVTDVLFDVAFVHIFHTLCTSPTYKWI